MPRYKCQLEYDGSPFCGWQRQEDLPSVQGALERAIAALTGETVTVYGAGRTDSGVHARGQVAHFDLLSPSPPHRLLAGVNFYLRPDPVVLTWLEEVPASFHARFSAIKRHYCYRIINRPSPLILDRDRAWWVREPLDLGAMQEAATLLCGRHDFASFRATACQATSSVITLDRLALEQHGEEIRCYASARSFLHHMVRNLVGTLRLIGNGTWEPACIPALLATRHRSAAGPTAPAAGLYLIGVDYPPSSNS